MTVGGSQGTQEEPTQTYYYYYYCYDYICTDDRCKHDVICLSMFLLTVSSLNILQRIRDLEDKTEIQRRQIKDLEEKVGHVDCLLSENDYVH